MPGRQQAHRPGFSVLELIVVVLIIAVLIGLLLPAVQKVGDAAARSESANNVRQIVLAAHGFAAAHGDRLPSLDGRRPNPGGSLHVTLLPYLEQGVVYQRIMEAPSPTPHSYPVGCYLSPADPTATGTARLGGPSSYAANARAFQPGASPAATFRHGTSSTLAFGEHYAQCKQDFFLYFVADLHGLSSTARRATLADGGESYNGRCDADVWPETRGSPPDAGPGFDTYPKIPTFQAAPRPADCHPLVAQTPHASGMICGVADGSVRIVAPTISTATYWGAITPAGGEVLSDW